MSAELLHQLTEGMPVADVHRRTPEQRTADLYFHVDPCFVNLRKCSSLFGGAFRDAYMKHAHAGDIWPANVFNDHLAVDLAMNACRHRQVRTLAECLAQPQPRTLFCSIESVQGDERIRDRKRSRVPLEFPFDSDLQVEMEFGTKHIVCDTGWVELSQPSHLAVIGQIRHVERAYALVQPAIMGAPTFDHWLNSDKALASEMVWHALDFHEIAPEDIDEFSALASVEVPDPQEWMNYMKSLPEREVKARICKLLGDVPQKDWGGEQEDHFTASVHLRGRRTTAAFAFKGRAAFREMTPSMLGKRGDQIYRLACTPAQILVVQHCHLISTAVRATLRSFAVAAHSPRRYCVMDGKDTYRLLAANGKL